MPLPQQAVSKFDFGLLAQQIESGTGSGGTRNSLSNQGLGAAWPTAADSASGAGNAEGRIRALDTFRSGSPTSTTGGSRCSSTWASLGLALFVALWLTLVRGGLRAVAPRQRAAATRWLGLASALALIGFIAGSARAVHRDPLRADVDHLRRGDGRDDPRSTGRSRA